MDKNLFNSLCQDISISDIQRSTIGTLSEKTLHSIIKNYLSPFSYDQEVKLGNYWADINKEDGIYEIQTRSVWRLSKKLTYFLSFSHVTVVYPICAVKHLVWIDTATGETTKKRKSPKTGSWADSFRELSGIKKFLLNPNLSVMLMLIDMDEYRLLNGWSADGKKGSERYERIPISLSDEIILSSPNDYLTLIPAELRSNVFDSHILSKTAHISLSSAQKALNMLSYMNCIIPAGKKGRSKLYKTDCTVKQKERMPL
jgi:hypothetical protein